MKAVFSKAIALFSLCAAAALAGEVPREELYPRGRAHYRFTARHIEAGGIGYDRGYTTLETFIAPDPGKWLCIPFFDGRGHVFNDGKWAANIGAGLRWTIEDRVWGINAYYDFRTTQRLHYNQIGAGFEIVGKLCDFRINGYLPAGRKLSSPYDLKFDSFSGHSMILSRKYQYAMKGSDAEIGFHMGDCDGVGFYGAIGPYYFIGPVGGHAWGGKGRFSFRYKDFISLEVSDSCDSQFHNHFQGQIAISVPFGGKSHARKAKGRLAKDARILTCRMLQPVYREEIIVVNTKKTYPTATDPVSGDPLYFVFVDNTSSSNGTFESPYPSLAQAESNSSEGSVIYVFPGDGTTRNMATGITLQANQKLWGSGVAHSILTGEGEVLVPRYSSSSPRITSLVDCVTLNVNNEVSGFSIVNPGLSAITTSVDPKSISISSCDISSSSTSAAISILTSTQSIVANIENVTINRNNNTGIFFSLGTIPSAELTLQNNFISGVSFGIFVDAVGTVSEANLIASHNTLANNRNAALYIAEPSGKFNRLSATIDSNACISNLDAGLVYNTDADFCNMIITNNVMTGQGNSGIVLTAPTKISQANFTIANNEVSGCLGGGDGVSIGCAADSLNLIISDNIFVNNTGSGIVQYANASNETLAITGNQIQNNLNQSSNAAGGIAIDLFNTLTATISGNALLNNTAGDAIGSLTPAPNGTVAMMLQNNTFGSEDFTFQWSGSQNACVDMTGNGSNANYNFTNVNSGKIYLIPWNIESASVNTGTFNLSDGVMIQNVCP